MLLLLPLVTTKKPLSRSVGRSWWRNPRHVYYTTSVQHESWRKNTTHIHTKTHANHNRNKITHLSELSVPVCQLRLIPVVGPCKSFATTKRQQHRVIVVVVKQAYQQQQQQQQQQVLLLLLLFFLNPSSSSSSHNLELASNNYPKLCKQIKKQQQRVRVREANCRSPGKDWRKL